MRNKSQNTQPKDKIAIIGMAGRFPGASNLDIFWENLIKGTESIQFFDSKNTEKNAIHAKGFFDNAEYFDADFFKFSPNKAKILDPQIRLLLELVWEAWENAGYNIKEHTGIVGVYTSSCSYDSYWQKNLMENHEFRKQTDDYDVFISNAKDFLATQIAYQFNFKGPAINIQTACSSSLVAVSQACNDILNDKCDMAVAGAACITFPLKNGYVYKEGMIYSKDGHCRAFAKDASGVVPGNGGGTVLLKRLSKAKADGDHVFATISGYAINNDGHNKLSYAAPSVTGQHKVLASAAHIAGINPSTITYIEAHGTGTPLGDQIEIQALKQYRPHQYRQPYCYLGSVKTNIGHLDVASGMAGLIKTALALYHKTIPKTLHAEDTNPNLKITNSGFKIANRTRSWPQYKAYPRRAGVSSFGVGGTNAHIILEELSVEKLKPLPATKSHRWQILPLSAQTLTSLNKQKDALTEFIRDKKTANLDDIAFTLQQGRTNFQERMAAICSNKEDAFNALYLPGNFDLLKYKQTDSMAKCAFLFSASLPTPLSLLSELYVNCPTFHDQIDICTNKISKKLKIQLAHFFKNSSDEINLQEHSIEKDLLIFITGYALAKCWLFLGIQPEQLIGYDLGEFIAACLAGIFSIEDAAQLITFGYKIKEDDTGFQTLSLLSSRDQIQKVLHGLPFTVIADNAPQNCWVAINTEHMKEIKLRLTERKIIYDYLNCKPITQVSTAFRSKLKNLIKSIKFQQPNTPILSAADANRTPITDITKKKYWVNKLCSPSSFSTTISYALSKKVNVFIEIGFSQQLCRWVQQINNFNSKQKILVVQGIQAKNLTALEKEVAIIVAKLWVSGVSINWKAWNIIFPKCTNPPKKIPLPTYHFDHKSYFVEPQQHFFSKAETSNTLSQKQDFKIYIPAWKKIQRNNTENINISTLLYVSDKANIAKQITKQLIENNPKLKVKAVPELLDKTIKTEKWLNNRANLWHKNLNVLSQNLEDIDVMLIINPAKGYDYFYDLTALSRSLKNANKISQIRLHIITEGFAKIHNSDVITPSSALALGPALCLPVENPIISARYIDLRFQKIPHYIRCIAEEIAKPDSNILIALRNRDRYALDVSESNLNKNSKIKTLPKMQFKKNGVYIITGGLGGIGLVIAEYLATVFKANLILISRNPPHKKHEQCLKKIKEAANQLLIFSADIGNKKEISKIISIVKERFGPINGVIHAASTSPEGMLQDKKLNQIKATFNAKIDGLHILQEILFDEKLDFTLLFSSINTLFGSPGIADYISANAYLNAFANLHGNNLHPLISIAWDAWKDVGMRHNYLSKKAPLETITGLSPNEGLLALEKVMSQPAKELIISKNQNINLNTHTLKKQNTKEIKKKCNPLKQSDSLEKKIQNIWEKLLGINSVALTDNFFDLNGDSLLAIEVCYRIKAEINIQISPNLLIEKPTFKDFIAAIANNNQEL